MLFRSGRLLTDWLGDGALRRFKMNFLGQVWPGDSLTAHATVTSVRDGLVELALKTLNQYGAAVPFASTVGVFLLSFYGLAYSLFPWLVIDKINSKAFHVYRGRV